MCCMLFSMKTCVVKIINYTSEIECGSSPPQYYKYENLAPPKNNRPNSRAIIVFFLLLTIEAAASFGFT